MVVTPLYFSLSGEDMVNLVVPVTGLLEVRLGLIVNTLASSSTQQLTHSSITESKTQTLFSAWVWTFLRKVEGEEPFEKLQ